MQETFGFSEEKGNYKSEHLHYLVFSKKHNTHTKMVYQVKTGTTIPCSRIAEREKPNEGLVLGQ